MNPSGSRSLIREENGKEHGSTPRVLVTSTRAPGSLRGSAPTPEKLFREPWQRMLKLQVFELGNWETWRIAFLEGLFTGMWVMGSIVIVCSAALWGSTLPGRTVLIIAGLHVVLFTIYISSSLTRAAAKQLNPMLTFMQMLLGLISPMTGLLIIIFQCIGAILGSLCAKELIPKARRDMFLLGGCFARRTFPAPNGGPPIILGFSDHQHFLAEFVFSFSFAYITCLFSAPKQVRLLGLRLAPFFVALNIGFNVYLSSSLQQGFGGSMFNPARCLGPAVAYGQPLWDRLWPGFSAPFVAAAAVALVMALVPTDHTELYAAKQDVFSKVARSLRGRGIGGRGKGPADNTTVYAVPPGRMFSETPETTAAEPADQV